MLNIKTGLSHKLKYFRKLLILGFILIMLFSGCKREIEFSFPEKPITLLVYTGPGGLIDVTARKFVDIANKYSDATFVVENKPGSGGIVALKNMLQKPADGYTLLASTKSNISKIVATGAETFIEDIDWAAMMMADPECIITYRQSGINTWDDLVADAKEKNGKQIWLGPANGGLDHVTALKVWDKAGINAKWIPFASGGKAIAALLGEQGVAYVGNPREVLGNDDLQIVAVSSEKRLPQFPNVPTLTELGLPDLENEYMWRGFVLKKGVPESVKEWYNELFQKVNADPEWRNYWERGGIEVKYADSNEFLQVVQSDKQDFTYYLSKLRIINTETDSFMAKLASGNTFRMLVIILCAVFLVLWFFISRSQIKSWLNGILLPVFFIFLSLIFYLLSFTFPSNEDVGPAIVPRLWIYILIPLNIALLVSILIKREEILKTTDSSSSVFKFVALLALYLMGIHFLGYFISTFLFVIAGILLLGYKNIRMTLIISACWLLFSYLVFYKLLYVPLPQGLILEMLF
ncbi:MAG: tripartite tricarboxylate transporter substrate-binding protein [Candidatus Stygibacter australis]|nr:tripartite tricarboxylate transporter substrate-binding protein [Candidatus Stygibacter australis]MDP8321854.1 tripartite tricarboxylate transporter substrate-binding protein [Candidatus Stygibacter australis]